MVQVTIHWTIAMITWLNLAANTIESGHQHSCEEQVWVRGWIGWAKLNALRRWVLGQWDTYSGTAIAFREDQVDGSFKAWYQALVAVCGGCSNRKQCRGMGQESTNVVAGQLRNTCIALAVIEQRLLVLPQALMRMHTRAIVTEHRFRHECHSLAMLASYILGDIFVEHQAVCYLHQRVETHVDLSLSCGTNFMMMCLDWYAYFFQKQYHLTTNVLECVIRSNREVSFFYPHAMTQVRSTIA